MAGRKSASVAAVCAVASAGVICTLIRASMDQCVPDRAWMAPHDTGGGNELGLPAKKTRKSLPQPCATQDGGPATPDVGRADTYSSESPERADGLWVEDLRTERADLAYQDFRRRWELEGEEILDRAWRERLSLLAGFRDNGASGEGSGPPPQRQLDTDPQER